VPLLKQPRHTAINQIRVSRNQPRWRQAHLGTVRHSLARTPFLDQLESKLQQLLGEDFELLVDLNIAGVQMIANWIGLTPRFIRASELLPTSRKTSLLVDLCRQVDATAYYSAMGSKKYMEEDLFRDAGIDLSYQTWEPPKYPQIGSGFVSHLSAIDALANVGPDSIRKMFFAGPTQLIRSSTDA